jgi:hypothetical protein
LKGRDNSGFPSVVASAGNADLPLDDVFGDIVREACRQGRRDNNDNNSSNNLEAKCQKLRFEKDGYAFVSGGM